MRTRRIRDTTLNNPCVVVDRGTGLVLLMYQSSFAASKHAGRLLFPVNEGPFGLWNIYSVYSDDRGQTWKMGEVAPGALVDTGKGKKISTVNEAQFVELKDGSIRFNVRRWVGRPCGRRA